MNEPRLPADFAFVKMSGHGNHFILADNRSGLLSERAEFTRFYSRAEILGADGVIFLERSENEDFRMRYLNRDGSEAAMCGNGSRCISHFAQTLGYKDSGVFETPAGPVSYRITKNGVRVGMPKPKFLFMKEIEGKSIYHVNTGVPHVVYNAVNQKEFEAFDAEAGRQLRYHAEFAPEGVNVNIVIMNDGILFVRTYERGIEAETLACGTGAVAAALFAEKEGLGKFPFRIGTRSGAELMLDQDGQRNVFLEGEVKTHYHGRIPREDLSPFLLKIRV